ncbi:superinfection immunity protein [bacterium]|nr:superinfection immunity protein [bacterium]
MTDPPHLCYPVLADLDVVRLAMEQKRFNWKPWLIAWAVVSVMSMIVQLTMMDVSPLTAILRAPFGAAFWLALLFVVFGFYFLPTILAKRRQQENGRIIFYVNLFLGWTALFWVVCLFWALLGDTREVGDGASIDTKKCPACAELVKFEARVCKHCGYSFDELGEV